MPAEDEPVLGQPMENRSHHDENAQPVVERIRALVTTQPYGVLCTHGDDQAYGSLVAFAFTSDLRHAVFATPVATRKYRLLSEHQRVALVVDNRPEHLGAMMQVEAITATGRARELQPGAQHEQLSRLLVERHPQLRTFVNADSCALFQIAITRYFHVSRFQEVRQWVPPDPS
jgi:hypothetical protein